MRSLLVVLALLACVQACVGVTITLQGIEPGETRALPTGTYAGSGISLVLVADSPFTGEDSTSVSIACNVMGTGAPTWSAPAQFTFYNGMRMSTTGGFDRLGPMGTDEWTQATCSLTWDAERADADWNAATLPGEFTFHIDAEGGRQVPVLYASSTPEAVVGSQATFGFGSTLPAVGSGFGPGARFDVQCYYTASEESDAQHPEHKDVWSLLPIAFAAGATQVETTWYTIPRIVAPFRCQLAARTTDPDRDRRFDFAVAEGLAMPRGSVVLRPLATIGELDLVGEEPNMHIDFIPGSTKTRVVHFILNYSPAAPVAMNLACSGFFTTTLSVLRGQVASNVYTLPSLPESFTPGTSSSCVLRVDTSSPDRDAEFDSLAQVSFDVRVTSSPSVQIQSKTQGVVFGTVPPPRIPTSVSSLRVQVSVEPAPQTGLVALDMSCVSAAGDNALQIPVVQFLVGGLGSDAKTFSLPHSFTSDVTFTCSLAVDATIPQRDEDFDSANLPDPVVFVSAGSSSGGGPGPTPGTSSGSDSGSADGSGSGTDSGASGSTSNPDDASSVVAFILSQPYSALVSLVSTLRDGLAFALEQPSSRFALTLQQAEGFESTHTLVRVIIDSRASTDDMPATTIAAQLKAQIAFENSTLYDQPIYADNTVMWVENPNSAATSAASLIGMIAAAFFALIAAAAI